MRLPLSSRACALRCTLEKRAARLCALKQDRDTETHPLVSFSTEEKDGVSRTRITPAAPSEEGTSDSGNSGNGASTSSPDPPKARSMQKKRKPKSLNHTAAMDSPLLVVTKPLPRVLILHTGGTLGMDPAASFQASEQGVNLKRGTGGVYAGMFRNT